MEDKIRVLVSEEEVEPQNCTAGKRNQRSLRRKVRTSDLRFKRRRVLYL